MSFSESNNELLSVEPPPSILGWSQLSSNNGAATELCLVLSLQLNQMEPHRVLPRRTAVLSSKIRIGGTNVEVEERRRQLQKTL